MKALILAGGFGSKLKRVIYDRPKSMAPIAGIPFLEHQIRLLKEQGINEIILCVSFMADSIKSYFGNGKKIGVNITYSEEEIPLGTAGAIKNAEKYIYNTFIVLNGDSYSQIDLNNFFEFHKIQNGIGTMALSEVEDPGPHGSAFLEGNKIMDFVEKKPGLSNLANSGVYIFNPEIFKYIEKEKSISLEVDIFPKLAKEGKLIGKVHKGYYIDIGLPETYTKFKQDVLNTMILKESNEIRDAIRQISKNEIDLVLITNDQKILLGVLTDRIIKNYIIKGGKVEDNVVKAMIKDPITAKITDDENKITKLFFSGTHRIPILDEEGKIIDVRFYVDRIKTENFPVVRGKAPLRISFAGGGTDLPYFFEKYGGAVVNTTINKYSYATIMKRADNKIIINSDIVGEIIVDSVKNLEYNGNLNIIKAIIKMINPDFGFELFLHNDIPPGRGLGSSACLAVLIISLFNHLMNLRYNDYKIAELAYKVETEELKIKGGWQDQYSTITGGFNYMEFNKDNSLVYPLRLKKEVKDELESHLLLCYVKKSHSSGELHESQEKSFFEDEDNKVRKLTRLKELTYEIREALLTNNLATFGRLLNESWRIKCSLSKKISNTNIDRLYEIGIKNGAYGGRLMGAGDGGYLLFFYSPKRRNDLVKALTENGGEILDFNFDFEGTKIWTTNNKF
tara:strand:+ start:818 stop:2851 length:2034 start_codon:yes stop_codon:yes gene_type:complete